MARSRSQPVAGAARPSSEHPRPGVRALALVAWLALPLALVAGAGAHVADVRPFAAGTLAVPTPTTNTSVLDLGMPLNVSVNASAVVGGSNLSSNWEYRWSGLPTNCTSANVSNLSCDPTQTGTFSVSVTVTDASDGETGTSAAVSISVHTDPTITAFSVTPGSVAVGGSLTFQVTAQGGTPPLSYVYLGLPAGCAGNSSEVICMPTSPHVYNTFVYVVDAVNFSSGSKNLSVNVTSSTTSSGPHPTAAERGVIAAILIIGFLVVALLFRAARSMERRAYRQPSTRPGGGPSSPPPSEPPTSGPPPAAPPGPPGGSGS